MKKLRFLLLLAPLALVPFLVALIPQAPPSAEMARLRKEAAAVTIVRDDWGIAHVNGHTDADAVFGMIYTQAEDDFNRVETNFITAMGRTAEAEGEAAIYQDLRMKLFIDPVVLQADYKASTPAMQALMNAWADGLNFFLATHPEVKPRVITHFEPWMALSFTEGSIGGDIEKVNVQALKAFYSQPATVAATPAERAAESANAVTVAEQSFFPPEPGGSNGMAVGPSITAGHHAMLVINPHTSFFFRSELQVTSNEGLNAYGAVTWGQFFIYQGFNEKAGWMHTSSGAVATSNYLETVSKQGDGFVYKYGDKELPVTASTITVPYKTASGTANQTFTVFKTQHGPVVANVNGKWETFALMNDPMHALVQSYTRTKAHDAKEFVQSMELHTNSSNNTIFADSAGDIAYWHANFIPRRDPNIDWSRPVDGSDPATDWHGVLSVAETPHLLNPANGWIYNSNNWPWSAAGPNSPKRQDYPVYVDSGRSESERGFHAIRVLSARKDFTLDTLQGADYDSYQPWFEKRMPALIKAWDDTPASDPLKAKTADQIALLRNWDLRWGANSVPTSLAIYWGTNIQRTARGGGGAAGGARGARGGGAGRGAGAPAAPPANPPLSIEALAAAAPPDPILTAAPDVMLQALADASDKLTADFGTWKTPWGDINRFQRVNDDINTTFSDSAPSIPVEFTTATWGSLASFATRTCQTCKKIYGVSGNSFISVIEFGPTVRARAVSAGGESGNPASKHFDDQAERYANGNLRDIYFYPDQLKGHTERTYHPGS